MAIAFDLKTDRNSAGGASSDSFSHTITGTNPILFVAVAIDRNGGTGGGDQTVSGITWNGTALSKIDATNYAKNDTNGVNDRIELWYLKAPVTGTKTIAITFTGNTKWNITALSYTGVDQSNPIGVTATPVSDPGNPSASISLTTGSANSWMISAISTFGDAISAASDTQRTLINNGITSAVQDELKAVAGVTTESWTIGGSARWAIVACEFLIAPATTTSTSSTTTTTSSSSSTTTTSSSSSSTSSTSTSTTVTTTSSSTSSTSSTSTTVTPPPTLTRAKRTENIAGTKKRGYTDTKRSASILTTRNH